MNKELMSAIKSITEEKIGDFLEEKVKSVFKDSYLHPSFQGWVYRIVLDDDGDLYITDVMSSNNTLMSVYKGDSLEVATVPAWNELGEVLNETDIDSLTEDEQKAVLEKYIKEELWGEDWEEYQKDNSKYNIYDMSAYKFEWYFAELFPDKWDEILDDYTDILWSEYGYDDLMRSILNTIQEAIENEDFRLEKY